MKSTKNQIVKKSNSLITAKYNLTKEEQKIILSIIAMIDKDDEDFHQYRFYIKDFLDNIDVASKGNYTYIKNIFKGLLEKPIEIKEKSGWIICNWLSGAKIDYAGYVDVEIYSGLKPYLLKLKESFTKYSLANVLSLRSNYSIRIYELLKQFESTGVRQISIDEFKEILKIPKSYQTRHLKPSILEPAKKEISEKTDIEFTYSFQKQGRKFTSIRFYIRTKVVKLQDQDRNKNKNKKNVKEDETLRPPEEVAKECYERNSIDGECKFKNFSFKPPYCKFCRINQGK